MTGRVGRVAGRKEAIYTELPTARKSSPRDDEFEFGVVEEISSRIIETEPVQPQPKSVAKETKKRSASKSKTGSAYQIPKNPFINQASVVKRPLSKNVYQKKIEPTKEVSDKPVAIISKPEKDSKAGVVVGIILTIILGAAAGTVAFLLLPK